MDFNAFNLLTWDKRILTPKGAKKFFLACKERLQFGICTHDTVSLRDYLGQIMVIGLTCYANNSVPLSVLFCNICFILLV